MITEDYISFETAKLLKEKGFECVCKVWYSEYTSQFGGEKYTSIEFDNYNKFNENYKFICSAPTLQMAMKWLREVHNLFIEMHIQNDGSYIGYIYNTNGFGLIGWDKRRVSSFYEQACEAAILYCLTNLI